MGLYWGGALMLIILGRLISLHFNVSYFNHSNQLHEIYRSVCAIAIILDVVSILLALLYVIGFCKLYRAQKWKHQSSTSAHRSKSWEMSTNASKSIISYSVLNLATQFLNIVLLLVAQKVFITHYHFLVYLFELGYCFSVMSLECYNHCFDEEKVIIDESPFARII
jgi:hypothetical protein